MNFYSLFLAASYSSRQFPLSSFALLRSFLMFYCLVEIYQNLNIRYRPSDWFIIARGRTTQSFTGWLTKSWKEWKMKNFLLHLKIIWLDFLYRLMSELWCRCHHWSLWLSTHSLTHRSSKEAKRMTTNRINDGDVQHLLSDERTLNQTIKFLCCYHPHSIPNRNKRDSVGAN